MNTQRIVFLILLCLCLTANAVASKKVYRFRSITTQNDTLVVTFHVNDLMSNNVIEGLHKGMTAAIEYQVELWKERPRWWDKVVTDHYIRLKVSFDQWEKRFIIETASGVSRMLNEDQIRRRCEDLSSIPVAPISQLEDGGRYRLAVKVILKPMSVENIQEIRRWLSGEVKQINPKSITSEKAPDKKLSDWLTGVMLNLTGFGNRIITAKSDLFQWKDGQLILSGTD